MSRLCTDIGSHSLYKYGEELCGDHIEVVEQQENTSVIVLADGLGSGVKANILSTLTSKIISTMMANQLSIEECVSTIALYFTCLSSAQSSIFDFYHYSNC